MKIVYLTWGETPRSYGVYNSQVIGQFVETKKIMPEAEFFFIAGLPIIHSGLVREKRRYKEELKKIKFRLTNIPFQVIPIFAPQNFVNSSKSTFSFMHIISNLMLKKRFRDIQPDVVHCRSYHAAFAAVQVREKYKFNYKIVFDGRGLYPEEVALKKGYSDSNSNYLFLKQIENKLLSECDVSVAVSDTMKEHYLSLKAKKAVCVYLSSSTVRLRGGREHIVREGDKINYGYVGALSDDTWHKPQELLDLYMKLRVFGKSKLIIVTTSNHEAIRKCFANIPDDEIYITSTKTDEELKNILQTFDFGLMSYFKPQSKREILLGNMVLAVKIVEYLAAGLPVIVNRYCGGAASIVEKYNLGIVYDPETFQEINSKNITGFVNDYKFFERSDLAKELFDYEVNAEKYKRIYKTIVE
ncbi:glycosyltransferase [Flavobacterium beibuense]|uniref:glycosyltransferase n=1 Tax=Flavobacterium beibuense TaxID=657326 RepID=UPI003A922B1F